jgi:hypothetical protein
MYRLGGLRAKSDYIVRREEIPMWQDYVIAIGQWVFLIALIPTITHKTQKQPISTSLMTWAYWWCLPLLFIQRQNTGALLHHLHLHLHGV